jgi:3'-phosphoadenosine 5'-phosphosulfate (PAPS) 3'-phosphatase
MEHKYLFVAVDAALKAGEEILSIYTDPASDFEIERKADHSPLTIADRKRNNCHHSERNSFSRTERRGETFRV